MDWRTRLAARIQELRDQEGLTQRALAKRIGCAPSSLSNWLSGAREPRELADFELLAKGIGVHPAWLLYGVGDNDPEATDLTEQIMRLTPTARAVVQRLVEELTH